MSEKIAREQTLDGTRAKEEIIMAVQNVNSTSAAAPQPNPLTEKTVTQDDFLKLLIAQLQNQDPLQPMDNQQFAAQLATFNSLGQLISINEKIGGLQSTQAAASQFNAASLIGKEITSNGDGISLQNGTPAKIGFQLGANAAKVVVTIQNSAGEVVRQIDAGAQSAGEKNLLWDGKDAAGRSVASGLYRFQVNAFDLNGKQVPTSGRVQGSVTGVTLDGGEPMLEVGALQVPLSSVIRVGSAL